MTASTYHQNSSWTGRTIQLARLASWTERVVKLAHSGRWTGGPAPKGSSFAFVFGNPIETLFVSSQSEFPVRFYDKNKLEDLLVDPTRRMSRLTRPFDELDCWTSRQGILLFVLFFESRSKRFSFRLNQSFR
ncbi:hypothetical protein F2Q69_00052479 [Brassica cretica]|uniref:Uncharacterized protein n=1 Tax=Brassica cretica TaxID=69181 RepID=A0A8S9N9V5_BRACR|nr:hypothetical protein F2Q69_00052479 [Brassica cretica]